MIAYRVNGKYINNIFLALHESWKTGAKLEFYCYDHEFDQHDWTVEPVENIDYLMTQHAHNLRERYERLILLWSGGTDSHTIYNIFRLANIHLDEIIIKADNGSVTYPEANVDWIKANHWDPTTKITRYDEFSTELRLMDLQNEDWVWADKGDLYKYGMTPVSYAVKFLCEKNHAGHTWKAIGGYEKPRLVYRNGHWFHRQLNLPLQPTMGHDHVEHFFFEPRIAVKQAHLVKKSVKQKLSYTRQPLCNNDWAESKWPKTSAGYRAWSWACGRHDEVTLGSSHCQKVANDEMIKTEINTGNNWKNLDTTADLRLKNDLLQGNPAALVYVKGLHNIRNEVNFMNFLRDNNWFRTSDRAMTNLNLIWSKEYDLGA